MAQERVERRLAAILAADVVGYGRLMGENEAGTLAALKDHQAQFIDPTIAEHRGRIVKLMGDGVLVEFASVVAAVECAAAIQRGMADRNINVPKGRRIDFRIGVNLGDVIIDGEDIHGDGVNVAARLEGLAEPGGICIPRKVFHEVRNKLDVGYEFIGEQTVKNIETPIPAYRVLLEPEAAGKVISEGRQGRPRWQFGAVAATVVVVVIAGLAVWNFANRESTTEAPTLSIVVLPFENLSGDPKQDYLADGITEDLITDLSRIRNAFVIARGTSFTYKGKSVNAREVAKELNVRYVLEGSVRRAGDQIRVNAQLIDGKTGAHIWSDRFDRNFTDVFALQNDITGRLASTLKVELLEAQSRALKSGPPANFKAWDYALQGTVLLHESGTKMVGEAKALFEKALELDPTLAFAWSGLARVQYIAYRQPVPGISIPHSNKLSLEAAQKAVSLDGKSSQAFNNLGFAYRAVGQLEKAVVSCETAIDLNPNNSDAYLCLGTAKMFSGKPAEAIPLFEKSALLNPRHRPYLPYMYMGLAYSLLEQYEESVKAFNKSVSEFPNHVTVLRGLASSLAKIGRIDEARVVLAKYVKLSRGKRDTIEKLRAYLKFSESKFERIFGGLRQAGMPEK